MDDQDNREYSRAPELEDLLALCKALNTEGVRYVLIGGFAVILHGFVRATKDIDLLIDASIENVQRLKRAMAFLPDNAIALIADDEVEKYQVVRIADEIVVDLINRPTATQREIRRARIILERSGGTSQQETAKRVGVQRPVVVVWEKRFREHGFAGLVDAKGRGRKGTIDDETRKRVIVGATRRSDSPAQAKETLDSS